MPRQPSTGRSAVKRFARKERGERPGCMAPLSVFSCPGTPRSLSPLYDAACSAGPRLFGRTIEGGGFSVVFSVGGNREEDVSVFSGCFTNHGTYTCRSAGALCTYFPTKQVKASHPGGWLNRLF